MRSTSSAFFKYFYNLSSLGFINFYISGSYISSFSSFTNSISASIKGLENYYYFGIFYLKLLLLANYANMVSYSFKIYFFSYTYLVSTFFGWLSTIYYYTGISSSSDTESSD